MKSSYEDKIEFIRTLKNIFNWKKKWKNYNAKINKEHNQEDNLTSMHKNGVLFY